MVNFKTKIVCKDKNDDTVVDVQNQMYYEYVLPPIWKRFVAELIDFIILVIIKLYISFMFLSTFHV